MASDRFVWHPVVHEAFGEHLLFLVINTGGRFSEDIPTQVEVALTTVGISSYNIYATYGRASIMLRCWINAEQESKLRNTIDQNNWRITEDLVSVETQYLWAEEFRRSLDPKSVPSHIDEITAVTNLGSTIGQVTDANLEKLRADGLLYFVPKLTTKPIKIYTIIDHVPGEEDGSNVYDRLVHLLRDYEKAGTPLFEISIHASSRKSYLIKGLVNDFDSLFKVTTAIAGTIQNNAYTSSTYLVASSTTNQSDQIEINVQLSIPLRMLSTILNRRTGESLRQARTDQRREIEAFYEVHSGAIAKFYNSQLQVLIGAIRGIVLYSIYEDSVQLSNEVGSLWSALESTLREYFQRAAIETGGANWYNSFKINALMRRLGYVELRESIIENSDAQIDKKKSGVLVPIQIRKLDLPILVEVFAKVADNQPLLSKMFEDDLGLDWRKRIELFRSYRNDFVHGRVYDGNKKDSFLQEPWSIWSADVVDASSMTLRAMTATKELNAGRISNIEKPKPNPKTKGQKRKKPSVFISYVHEDSDVVDRIQNTLSGNQYKTWRDIHAIPAGARSRDHIQKGIEGGDFFIACFSANSESKPQSYMREEIISACELLRTLSRDNRWFIPLRINECAIPEYPIGPSETLRDLQWIDLFPDITRQLKVLMSMLRAVP